MATQLKPVPSAFKIEKGVPRPERSYGKGAAPKYPWADMEIGDSFFAPLSAYACRVGEPSISKYATTMHRLASARRDGKFSVRQETDGIRIWRVA